MTRVWRRPGDFGLKRCLLATSALLLTLPAVSGSIAHAQVGAPACEAFRWTTLGTAAGPMPAPDRGEPANLLTAGDQQILVDTGDGTVNALARSGLSLAPVTTVFISHHHMDHTGGLAAVIGLRWMNQFSGPITVYGPPGTRQLVDGIVESMAPQTRVGFGLGETTPPPSDSVRVVELRGGDHVMIGAVTVTTAANSHFDHDGPVAADAPTSLSYRFTMGSRSITYTGDTGPSTNVAQLAKGSNMLVSEVIDFEALFSLIQRVRKNAPQAVLANMREHLRTHHLSPADVGRMAANAGVGHVVLTHLAIPGALSASEPVLRQGVREHFHGQLDIARDMSSYDLGCG